MIRTRIVHSSSNSGKRVRGRMYKGISCLDSNGKGSKSCPPMGMREGRYWVYHFPQWWETSEMNKCRKRTTEKAYGLFKVPFIARWSAHVSLLCHLVIFASFVMWANKKIASQSSEQSQYWLGILTRCPQNFLFTKICVMQWAWEAKYSNASNLY